MTDFGDGATALGMQTWRHDACHSLHMLVCEIPYSVTDIERLLCCVFDFHLHSLPCP